MRRKQLFRLRRFSMLLLTAFSLLVGLRGGLTTQPVAHIVQTDMPMVVLDAGHGGFDGGAGSADGVLEKDLNLELAKRLELVLLQRGISVVMTRDEDEALRHEGKSGKSADLRARASLADEYPSAVLISIHMNKFEIPKYSGAQVFYSSNNPSSETLASCIQTAIREQLQPQNSREIKQADKGIYLLLRAKQPAVLVECGFLSNPEETVLLQQEDYQQQMAEAIANGLESYYTMEKEQGKNPAETAKE